MSSLVLPPRLVDQIKLQNFGTESRQENHNVFPNGFVKKTYTAIFKRVQITVGNACAMKLVGKDSVFHWSQQLEYLNYLVAGVNVTEVWVN